MRSPIVAMLWENWRLTRVEAVARIALTLVGGALILTAPSRDAAGAVFTPGSAAAVFFFGTMIHACLWLSIAKLNGGKLLDGYHPGFPFPSLYSRPLATATLVGVPMAYAAGAAAATYLLWALPMRGAFDLPLPIVPVAAWVATLVLVQAAGYWSTRSKLVQWAGTTIAFLACLLLSVRRAQGPTPDGETAFSPERWAALFDYSYADYTLMAVIGLVSYGLTVAGVARQRRGDAGGFRPRTAEAASLQDWVGRFFPFPCPTSSPLRAQIWFDLRSSGLAILAAGLVSAVAIPLAFAAGIHAPFVRSFALSTAAFGALLVLGLGANAFGIRRRQGRVYASVFEATLASATASLAGRKVLVRTACVLVALCMVAASFWLSVPIIAEWDGPPHESAQKLVLLRAAAAARLAELTAVQAVALAVLACGSVALTVTARAVLEALLARYRRRLLIVGGGILLYGSAFVARQMMPDTADGGFVRALDAVFGATLWIVVTAVALATAWLFRNALRESVLTPRQAAVAVLLAAVPTAAWLALVDAAGAPLGAMSATTLPAILSSALLPLAACVLAPWALSRVRHT